jgi:transcriptional regulator with XRE-family HTH domain
MRNELKQQSLPWDEPSEDSVVQHTNRTDSADMMAPATPEVAATQDVDEIMPYQPETNVGLDMTSPMSQQTLNGVRIACGKRDAVLAETGIGTQVPKPVSEPEFNDAVEAASDATGTPVSSLEELAATLHNLACNSTVGPLADAEAEEFAEPEADYFVEPEEAAEFAESGTDYFAESEDAVLAEMETSAAKVEKTPSAAMEGEDYSPLISANADLEPNTLVPSDDGRKSVGRKLRESRERLHLSVSEVAEATRIRNDYIIALEQHTINETPLAPVYVRSYIKSLCRHYDIRAETMLAEYTSALPESKTSHAGLEQIDGNPPATNGEERFSIAVKWSMVAIFALIAVLTISFFVIDRNLDIATAPPESTLQPLQEKDLGRFMPPSELLLRKLEVPSN